MPFPPVVPASALTPFPGPAIAAPSPHSPTVIGAREGLRMAISRKPRRPHLSVLALEDRAVPSAVSVPDFGFEASAVATFKYTPAGSPWAFTGTAGLSANGTAFTAGNP